MTPCLSLEVSTESLVTTESSATSVLVSDLVKINKNGQNEKGYRKLVFKFYPAY